MVEKKNRFKNKEESKRTERWNVRTGTIGRSISLKLNMYTVSYWQGTKFSSLSSNFRRNKFLDQRMCRCVPICFLSFVLLVVFVALSWGFLFARCGWQPLCINKPRANHSLCVSLHENESLNMRDVAGRATLSVDTSGRFDGHLREGEGSNLPRLIVHAVN